MFRFLSIPGIRIKITSEQKWICAFVLPRWNFPTTKVAKRGVQISRILYRANSRRKITPGLQSVVVSRCVLMRRSCAAVTNIAAVSWSYSNVVRCRHTAAVTLVTWDHTHRRRSLPVCRRLAHVFSSLIDGWIDILRIHLFTHLPFSNSVHLLCRCGYQLVCLQRVISSL